MDDGKVLPMKATSTSTEVLVALFPNGIDSMKGEVYNLYGSCSTVWPGH